ncbi:hypothetical protein [Zobellia galactanivorans]|uniref:Hypothetical membrane protein n=1 Tax=Zobellia galactanivorans (strain DSM 12802 / CCUG 47099 / CIP 106680 / NCIMB 13871 / Dsij) TaxID=63186 RepID=G0KZW4_ZOBGA|nr:hypothetical protein [Zobellia galactanivorans]CAZ97222.1 Hypothetical membrane protein [Zobellia galactanivorans]
MSSTTSEPNNTSDEATNPLDNIREPNQPTNQQGQVPNQGGHPMSNSAAGEIPKKSLSESAVGLSVSSTMIYLGIVCAFAGGPIVGGAMIIGGVGYMAMKTFGPIKALFSNKETKERKKQEKKERKQEKKERKQEKKERKQEKKERKQGNKEEKKKRKTPEERIKEVIKAINEEKGISNTFKDKIVKLLIKGGEIIGRNKEKKQEKNLRKRSIEEVERGLSQDEGIPKAKKQEIDMKAFCIPRAIRKKSSTNRVIKVPVSRLKERGVGRGV